MKLNLGCGKDIRNGYLNLDIVPVEGADPNLFRQHDITNLDDIAEDDSVEEMLMFNILQVFSHKYVLGILNHWISKLQPGGVLKIVVPDVHEQALSLTSGQVDIQHYMLSTYGTHANDYDYVKTGFDLTLLVDLLVNKLKLNILNKHCANTKIIVEAEKSRNE